MNAITLAIAYGLLLSQNQAYAQKQTPTFWSCQAECFDVTGSDGSTLVYSGTVPEYPEIYTDPNLGLQAMRESCSGILIVRKLAGTYTVPQTSQQSGSSSSSYYYYNGRRIVQSGSSSSSYSNTSRVRELRGVFQWFDATAENACQPVRLNGILTPTGSMNGDHIGG